MKPETMKAVREALEYSIIMSRKNVADECKEALRLLDEEAERNARLTEMGGHPHDKCPACAALTAERDRLQEVLEAEKKHRAWVHATLKSALGLLDKDHPARGPVAAAAFVETRPLTATELAYGAALAEKGE